MAIHIPYTCCNRLYADLHIPLAKNVPLEYIMYSRPGARAAGGPGGGNPRIDLLREGGAANGSSSSGCAC